MSGQVAFEEENLMVGSLETLEDEVIKMASSQLVASHRSKFPEEKILRQRHQVRVVHLASATILDVPAEERRLQSS